MQSTSYKVFARTYRPKMFSEILGQDVAVQIFQNALKHNKLSHAILLTGIRGVGKTTSARLLAKSLCCLAPQNDVDPCGECASCLAFQNDQHTDVIEMDAASHTGVDDVRDLIEGVAYAPTQGKYRIYIIDEVHMLSKSAFNALLKTLEEPPKHAKFLFATTELEKVPETIVSRCLQIQLRPINVETIIQQLQSICSQEGLNLNVEALTLIAETAQGSMRDALSVLEKIASFTRGQEEEVTVSTVERILGRPPETELLAMCKAIELGNVDSAIQTVRSFFQHDIAPNAVLKGLLKLIHHSLCEKVLQKNTSVGKQKTAEVQFQNSGVQHLNRLWSIAHKGLEEVIASPLPKEACEVVIIRLMHANELPPLKDIIEKIETQLTQTSQNSQLAPQSAPAMQQTKPTEPSFNTLESMVIWLESQKDPHLLFFVKRDLRVHHFEHLRIECSLKDPQHQALLKELKQLILARTGENWVFEIVQASSEAPETLYEQHQSHIQAEQEKALNSDIVQYAANAFPNSEITVQQEKVLTH